MSSAEAMVTARMLAGKKEEGNRILASLGTNASSAVNQLYDYIIEKKALPFEASMQERHMPSAEEVAAAANLIDGIVIPMEAPYLDMTLKDARMMRLGISSDQDEHPS